VKLSLDALKERAEATASMDLLATISGGNENACHDCNGAGSTGYTPSQIAAAAAAAISAYMDGLVKVRTTGVGGVGTIF
jgi:hypothetical protein